MIGQINAVVFSFALWTYGWARGRWILHEANHTREQTAGGGGGLASVPAGTAASEGPPGQPPATPGAARQRGQPGCLGFQCAFLSGRGCGELLPVLPGLAPAPVGWCCCCCLYSPPSSPGENSENGAYVCHVVPEASRRELAKGFHAAIVAKALREHGHLNGELGRLAYLERLPGLGHQRVYRIRSSIIAEYWWVQRVSWVQPR